MRIKICSISLLIVMILQSCSEEKGVFPDTVSNTKSDDMVRLKGSKFFAKVPADYKPVTSLVGYQKDDNTYFQVMRFPNSNFLEHKNNLTKEAIENKGVKVDIREAVMYNGLEGLYFEGPSSKPGETKIELIFGDETFVTIIEGICLTHDKQSRDELRNIFIKSYYDKLYLLDPLELANFQLDETITNFKYATTVGNRIVYTPNGKEDDSTGNPNASAYQIVTLETHSLEKVKELMEIINAELNTTGFKTSDIKRKEILINGNQTYEITMDVTDKNNKKTLFYQVGIRNAETMATVLFMGADGDNGLYYEKLKATAQSIKLN